MLFHSLAFAALLAVTWPLYLALRSTRLRNLCLLVASYVFYGWWEWRYLPLLALSTAVDYGAGLRLARTERPAARRALLALSCLVNLGLLAFFKYAGFFTENANGVAAWLGLDARLPALHLLLPIGISFYTFQSMAYTIDVYRGRFPAHRSILEFATYISFFPQLVAGPIERPSGLLAALSRRRRVTLEDVRSGFFLFALGFASKAMAERLAAVADPAFASPATTDPWSLLWGVYAFTFQVYADFYGYTQMARGVARLFGIRLVENFRMPFLATNYPEQWSRWHMSLTLWVRDYLFTPLVRWRRGRVWAFAHTLVAMTLVGLWHGAAWNFVAWGAYCGAVLVLYQVTLARSRPRREAYLARRGVQRVTWAGLGLFATFHCFVASAVLFRAQPADGEGALASAVTYTRGLLDLPTSPWSPIPVAFWTIGVILAFDLLQLAHRGESDWSRLFPTWSRWSLASFLVVLGIVLGSGDSAAFIYFQF